MSWRLLVQVAVMVKLAAMIETKARYPVYWAPAAAFSASADA